MTKTRDKILPCNPRIVDSFILCSDHQYRGLSLFDWLKYSFGFTDLDKLNAKYLPPIAAKTND